MALLRIAADYPSVWRPYPWKAAPRSVSVRAHGTAMSGLRWLPDGRGLIATASEQLGFLSQVWYVSYPGGEARRITNDLNNYSGLSLTGDASALVTVQSETTSRIWVVSTGDAGSAREITTGRRDGARAAWPGPAMATSFSARLTAGNSRTSGSPRRTARAGGRSRRKALTTSQPAVCGDGRHLVFLSYRAGTPHIWRSDLDGGNVRQLTSGEGELVPSCSPDGTWLTYGTLDAEAARRMENADRRRRPVRIWDQYGWSRISPDGKSVLVRDRSGCRAKGQDHPGHRRAAHQNLRSNSELGGGGGCNGRRTAPRCCT